MAITIAAGRGVGQGGGGTVESSLAFIMFWSLYIRKEYNEYWTALTYVPPYRRPLALRHA